MGKLRLSSWFSPSSPSSATADAETKKQNRRSFSALSASFRHKDVETNGTAAPVPKAAETETSRMAALARKIANETEKLEAYMKENNLPMPSFDVDAPADFPKLPDNVLKSRQEIIFATKELALLAHGPREFVRWGIWEVSSFFCLLVAFLVLSADIETVSGRSGAHRRQPLRNR